MSQKDLPIVLTVGDPDGIGAEIIVKALNSPRVKKLGKRFFIVGARSSLLKQTKNVVTFTAPQDLDSKTLREKILLDPAPTAPEDYYSKTFFDGRKKALLEGYQAGWSLERAFQWVWSGRAAAMVTGPLDKARLQAGGYTFNGHTDFLAALLKEEKVLASPLMTFYNPTIVCSLVTDHVPISQLPKTITKQRVYSSLLTLSPFVQTVTKKRKVRIAVLGLNPHAGEKSLLGVEEKKILLPAIEMARAELGNSIEISDPLGADSFWGTSVSKFDGVLAMYHDQGLAPMKLLNFRETVHTTLGLPIIRTSVDHGTAFDIAGKNKADPSSLISAIELATHLISTKPNSKRK